MIALPVTAVAASDIVVRSHQLTAAERADRDLGSVADALVRAVGAGAVEQTPDASTWGPVHDTDPPTATSASGADSLAKVRAVLPAGSKTVAVRDSWALLQSAADVYAPTAPAQVTLTDPADPIAAGMFPTVAGRPAVAPDEVELAGSLAKRLGVGVGDRVVTFRPDHTLRVVGIVGQRWQPGVDFAVGVLGGDLDQASARVGASYLVDSPSPISWDDVRRANANGLVVQSRAVYLNPPPASAVPLDQSTGGLNVPYQAAMALAVAGGMALLEIVLLAGPAFAVGARRQRRELALLAAIGGDRIDLQRVVLGQGIVLGLAGGAIGAAGGIGLGALGRGLLSHHAAIVFGGMHWHPLEIAGAAALGVVTGVLAAIMPARAASRQNVVAALAGRRGTVGSSRLLVLAGVCAFVLGVAVAAVGASHARRATFILAGAVLAELGLVACTPMLVGLAGRAAPLLHGSMRLAVRDAARNRSRSAPAVAAILAAAAGCVGVLVYTASEQAHDRAGYTPSVPIGSVAVYLPWGGDAPRVDPDAVLAAVRSALPVGDAAVVYTAAGTCRSGTCTSVHVKRPAVCRTEPGVCYGDAHAFAGPVVAGPGLVPLLTGRADPAAEEMLRSGGAVVFNRALLTDGKVTLQLDTYAAQPASPGGAASTTVRPQSDVLLPAVVAPHGDTGVPDVVLSPQAAKKLGLGVEAQGIVASTTRMPSHRVEDLARTTVQRAGGSGLHVERGWQDPSGALDLALVAIAGFVIVGASGVATGLAIADGRADHATLAAVGAAPGVRRRLAAAQSAVLGLLGVVAGVVAGIVPAAAVLHSHSVAAARAEIRGYPLVLPWTPLLVLILGVPLLGAVCAFLLTRSRLPLGRRAT
jgi:putative ABC transport system permease protein